MAGGREPRVLGRSVRCRGRRLVLGSIAVEAPDGRLLEYDALLHPGAVAVIALDDEGRLLVERQFRPAVGGWILEIPAGTLEPGEPPEETARRELVEETGYEPGSLEHVFSVYPSPGTSTEVLHFYLARGLRYVGERREPDEYIEVEWAEPRRLLGELLRSREPVDSKLLLALLYLATRGG